MYIYTQILTIKKLKRFIKARDQWITMKFGLWSSSPDWKLARQIYNDSWNIRRNSTVPEDLNKALERILKKKLPDTEKKFNRQLRTLHDKISEALHRYRTDFSKLEEIKQNVEILEKERIKKINDFERLVGWLKQEKKLDVESASYALGEANKIKHRLRSDISRDRGREAKLRWMSHR